MPPSKDTNNKANLSFNLDYENIPSDWNRPNHDEFTQNEIISGKKTMTITIDQDIHFILDDQKRMHSRRFKAAKLNTDEARIQYFHNWLDHYMK